MGLAVPGIGRDVVRMLLRKWITALSCFLSTCVLDGYWRLSILGSAAQQASTLLAGTVRTIRTQRVAHYECNAL